MNQEFVLHPTIKNYEASRDGEVRHWRVKKPVGTVSNSGYLMFTARGGGKRYLNHRFVYAVYNGEIPKVFVVEHIDENRLNNNLNNLQVVTQSENTIRGNTDTCKMVGKRSVKSVNTHTAEEIIFYSMTATGKHFGICSASVRKVAEKIYKSAL